MIDTCDPAIASWYDNGTTFVVKSPDRFAAEVIPEFFKHNNFSSFVRQLNFYGFRKIKSDALRLRDAETSEESKFWKFRHEKFQEGRSELLAEIKKSNQNESADKQDVDHLKSEVRVLSDRLWTATREIEQLKKLVGSLIDCGTEIKNANYHSEVPAKKRKLIHDGPPSPIASTGDVLQGTENATVAPIQVQSHSVDMATKGDVIPTATEETPFMPPMVKPDSAVRSDSVGVGAFSAQEEEMLASLFALDTTDDVKMLESVDLPDAIHSNLVDVAPIPSPDVSPKLIEKVRAALAALPREMQELFVDRLVAVIGAPDAFKIQAEAMASLASAAAEEARRRLVSNGRSEDDPELANMTLAVLDAYLKRLIRNNGESKNPVASNARIQM